MTDEEFEIGNKLIAAYIGHQPEIEYCVGKDGSTCYNPKHVDNYFPTPASQKVECERWLKEQKDRFPDGWVTKEGYQVKKYEWYLRYDDRWEYLMPVVITIAQMDDSFRLYIGNVKSFSHFEGQEKHVDQSTILSIWNSVTAHIRFKNSLKAIK
jgi:hypothetical protein